MTDFMLHAHAFNRYLNSLEDLKLVILNRIEVLKASIQTYDIHGSLSEDDIKALSDLGLFGALSYTQLRDDLKISLNQIQLINGQIHDLQMCFTPYYSGNNG